MDQWMYAEITEKNLPIPIKLRIAKSSGKEKKLLHVISVLWPMRLRVLAARVR
jgi:hypothetical protein